MHPTKPDLGPCHVWTGALNRYGYGHFTLGPLHVVRAHKLALTLAKGPPPDDKRIFALHSCDNRACCAELHLRWGTMSENNREIYDRFRRPRKPERLILSA